VKTAAMTRIPISATPVPTPFVSSLIETLERLVLQSRLLQWFLLKTHERALRKLLPELSQARRITIVGGGMFPRTAVLLRKLIPFASLRIIDASCEHLEIAKAFLKNDIEFEHANDIEFEHAYYAEVRQNEADLLIIPLSFHGDRQAIYQDPPAPMVLIHDWIWARQGQSAVVSLFLLKRMNLVFR
jgi:hypothetical protein